MMCHPEPAPPFGFETSYKGLPGPAPLSSFYRFKGRRPVMAQVHRYVRPDSRIFLYQAAHFKDRWWIALPQWKPRLHLQQGTYAEVMGHLATHLLTKKT